METFIAVLHIAVALILIGLVLVQDSQSGSVGGAFGGGGGSNSVLGATGATSLAQKMTRWTAVVFAVTSLALTLYASRAHRSVVDSMPVVAAPVTPTAPVTTPEVPATTPPAAAQPTK